MTTTKIDTNRRARRRAKTAADPIVRWTPAGLVIKASEVGA